jgi:uncharacterized protein
MPNPCLACGACCAHYRVSFHWWETERFLGGVTPAGVTVQISQHRVAMAGTERTYPRCVALEGQVGEAVCCSIYEQRPSPCREFSPSWANGVREERCDQARKAHGLPPLEPPRRSRRSKAS